MYFWGHQGGFSPLELRPFTLRNKPKTLMLGNQIPAEDVVHQTDPLAALGWSFLILLSGKAFLWFPPMDARMLTKPSDET